MEAMFTKFVPTILLVLTGIVVTAKAHWPTAAPMPVRATPGLVAATEVRAAATTAPAAADDFRINLDGVTADAYNLEPLVEDDAAHTRLMIAGIVGRKRERER